MSIASGTTLTIYRPILYGGHGGRIADHQATGGFTVSDLDTNGQTTLVGDADELAGSAVATPNHLIAEGEAATIIGDALTVTGYAQAGHNFLDVTAQIDAAAAGDAVALKGHAQGGYNYVRAFSVNGSATAFGDAEWMGGHAQGGSNYVSISPTLSGNAYGDAQTMTGFARGGDNTVVGGPEGSGLVQLYGDAAVMTGHAQGGGNDLIAIVSPLIAQGTTIMYGDAATVKDHASGGGNTLEGAENYGDAPSITDIMYGDGLDLLGHATGGGNTLVSGSDATDIMWGGAAFVSPTAHVSGNTFVFRPQAGHDTIMDFRSGMDHIDLVGLGVTNFQQLTQLFEPTANGLDIVFDEKDSILLHGVSQVVTGDFVFT